MGKASLIALADMAHYYACKGMITKATENLRLIREELAKDELVSVATSKILRISENNPKSTSTNKQS